MSIMIIALAAAVTASGTAPSPAASAVVSEAERRMDVIQKNQPLIEELVAMGAVDQLVRTRWLELRKSADAPTRAALKDVWDQRIAPIDLAHERRLKEILEARSEWFRVSEVGRQAAGSAFLIVQHSDDLALQKLTLAKMEPLLAGDEVDKGSYALLYDRVAVTEGRPQRYATQGTDCNGDLHAVPRDLEDPSGLDKRRAAMGLEPIADYLASLDKMYGRCEVPPVMRNRAKAK